MGSRGKKAQPTTVSGRAPPPARRYSLRNAHVRTLSPAAPRRNARTAREPTLPETHQTDWPGPSSKALATAAQSIWPTHSRKVALLDEPAEGPIERPSTMPSTQSSDRPLAVRLGLGRALGASLLVAALAGWSAPAKAQPDAETEVARVRFREGVALYDQGEFEKARLAFLEAHALKPHPAVLLNLAQSELRAGRFADAANNLAAYLRESHDSDNRERATAAFDEAKARSIELRVRVSAAGAQIFVDGIERGNSPLSNLVYLTPGSHAVRAQKGKTKVTKVVTAQAGERLLVPLQLPLRAEPRNATPQPALATQPRPAAAPGKEAAAAPAAASKNSTADSANSLATADAGSAESPGFVSWVGARPLAIASVATAAVSLTAAAVMAGLSVDRYNYTDDVSARTREVYARNVASGELVNGPGSSICGAEGVPSGNPELFGKTVPADRRRVLTQEYATACSEFSKGRSAGKTFQTAGWVGLGLGVGLGAATLAAYLTSDSPTVATGPETAPRWRLATVQPMLSPSLQGVWVSVSF